MILAEDLMEILEHWLLMQDNWLQLLVRRLMLMAACLEVDGRWASASLSDGRCDGDDILVA